MKRVFDLLFASVALIVTAPLWAVAAIAVYLESRGPIFFRQVRVGRGGVPFTILKFRSMRPDIAGELVTTRSDPRITATGAILRKTKVDELPQLINVLRGDMSIVGPRPEVPVYVEKWPDDARQTILSVRPGITDTAAIKFRHEDVLLAASADPSRYYEEVLLPEKVALYQEYVKTSSVRRDVGIILETLRALFPARERDLPHGEAPHALAAGGRILHVTAIDFTTAKMLTPQLDHLVRSGYSVRVATGRTDETYWSALQDYEPADIRFPRSMRPIAMARALAQLVGLVRAWRPDIVHLHAPASSLPVRLLPRFVWPKNCKLVYTVHGYIHPWPPSGLGQSVLQRLEKFESRVTALTLYQSTEDHDEASRRGYPGRLVYLGNGVQDDWFEIPSRVAQRSPLSVLFVGRMVREKGVLDLLNAVARCDDVVLHLVGDALPSDRDSAVEEAASMIERLGLEHRVVRHGMLVRDQIQALYNDVDIMVLPSYREGVPRSVIEALAAGRPVVATKIRGCSELIVPGVNGLLVPPRAPDALAEAIRLFAEMPPEEYATMAVNARTSARRESEVLHRLVEAYQSIGVFPRRLAAGGPQ